MKILHRLMLLTLILASALPGYGAWSETDGVYYIKNGDGLEEAFTVDGSITYCNPGTNVPSYKDNGAVFVPKNAGEVISIEVLENTCDNTCYVLVYDGAIAKVGYGTSDGKDQSGYLPAGWKLKLQNGSAGTTYTSESADGKLSLGFSSKSGSKGTVKIRVSSVKATDITADTDVVSKFTGLKDQTAYKVYYFVNSALNVESDVIATAEVTTLRHIEPLTLEVEGGATKAGEAVILTSAVAGGDEPYTYKWVDQMQNEVASTATAEVSPANTQAYWLTVTSADGQTATAKTHVDVTGEFVPATFEDNKFNVTLAPENEDDAIYSGSLAFNGATMWYGSTSYWNGYTFSNDDSSEFTGLDDQYRSAAGGGHLSDDFCVAFPQAYSIDVTNDSEGSLIPGMYVTNSAYTYFSMTNGDAYTKKFDQGDWYLLTVKGVKADDTEESIDFYLADLRSDNADEHYILDTWQWIDLSSFGKVTALKFELSSSDTGNWGMNTPGYFCIDDLGATLGRKAEAVEIEEGQTIDLADFFEHNADSNASENYSIVPAEGVSLEGTTLSVEASTVVDAQMTQAGQSQYIALTVTVDERHDGLSTLTAAEGVVAVEIYSLDGVKIAGQPVDKPVDVATGVYIVRYLNADGVAVDVRKIAIR